VQKIMDWIPYISLSWSAPYQISLAIWFLWGILGPAALAGLAVMLLLIPINGIVFSKLRSWQVEQMKKKGLRIKMMNEILSGVKVSYTISRSFESRMYTVIHSKNTPFSLYFQTLKLYAWEKSFENQVMKVRREEIDLLKKAAYLECLSSFLWNCSQFLVCSYLNECMYLCMT